MNRANRIALLAALALLVALAGNVLANRAPVAEAPGVLQANDHDEPDAADENEDEGPPSDAAVDRVVDRLAASEIEASADRVRELAELHGLGGAVRLLAWEAEGVSIDDVLERRAAGEGWGAIAKELGVHPGIGSVMGGGHGRDSAPGQQKDRGTDD
ncbi:MAG TPA: hypothetical protein VLA76_03785 [Candidatus Angelobacter sp.]|nr:hypothetical protein [Candidatus Angelobacter sp.]